MLEVQLQACAAPQCTRNIRLAMQLHSYALAHLPLGPAEAVDCPVCEWPQLISPPCQMPAGGTMHSVMLCSLLPVYAVSLASLAKQEEHTSSVMMTWYCARPYTSCSRCPWSTTSNTITGVAAQ